MNKKATGDLSTYSFAIVTFLIVCVCLIWLVTNISSSKNIEMSSDYKNLSLVSYEGSTLYISIENISQTARDPIENNSKSSLSPLFGLVQWVVNRYEDSMFAKAIKTVSVIWHSINALTEYMLTLGGIFQLPDIIINVLTIAILVLIVILGIYFFRGMLR